MLCLVAASFLKKVLIHAYTAVFSKSNNHGKALKRILKRLSSDLLHGFAMLHKIEKRNWNDLIGKVTFLNLARVYDNIVKLFFLTASVSILGLSNV